MACLVAQDRDLFGGGFVEKWARFADHDRIELGRRWGEGPQACIIGHNPSKAGRRADDPTSIWWIKWCRSFGFGSYVAVNLYPWVSAHPRDCYVKCEAIEAGEDWGARDRLHFVNLPAVVKAAKRADQIFVCWGAIARDHDWIEHVIEEIQTGEEPWPDLWCWGTNKDGSPKHPMARGRHRVPKDQPPILWRAAH